MKGPRLADDLPVDLGRLIVTRMLIQASSGAGKSWALRRLLEQTHGAVQHLVIDPEGEFFTLRERFDYVLAAKHGGEAAAAPRIAALLAERLLEIGASAILDLYDLPLDDRKAFVRAFLEAVIDAPRKLWHPALVVVDEAHVFCPEKGMGESESAGAVKDLCTRGRKRGFAAVLATQRLAKLSKDAAAECTNKLIGRTNLDVDVKRALDELGFGRERGPELKTLGDGDFFAFGPALTIEARRIHVGPVLTTHPKVGTQLAAAPPPPTEAIKALLPKLSDLPAEQERKAKTEADLRTEIRSLKAQLAARPVVKEPEPVEVKVSILTDAHAARLEATAVLADKTATSLSIAAAEYTRAVAEVRAALAAHRNAPAPRPAPVQRAAVPRPAPAARAAATSNGHLPGTQQKILDVAGDLFERGITPTREAIAKWLGIHPNGGRYGSDLAALRAGGYLSGGTPTDQGAALCQPRTRGLEGAVEVLEGSQRRILDAIVKAERDKYNLTRETLAESLGLHPNGGRYGSDLARLRTMGIITERGPIAPKESLFR